MAYKLLGNVITPGSIQHNAGEILDIKTELGESLVKRGLAKTVETAATHIYGQANDESHRGGKLVNPAATPPAPTLAEEVPASPQNQQQAQAVASSTPAQPTADDIAKTAASVK